MEGKWKQKIYTFTNMTNSGTHTAKLRFNTCLHKEDVKSMQDACKMSASARLTKLTLDELTLL